MEEEKPNKRTLRDEDFDNGAKVRTRSRRRDKNQQMAEETLKA